MPFDIECLARNLYRVKITNYTDESFQTFVTNYRFLFQRTLDTKVSFVFSTLELTSITPLQVMKLSLFLQNMKSVHREKLEKFAIVVNNRKILRVLNGVFAVVKPVRPYHICTAEETAIHYLRG